MKKVLSIILALVMLLTLSLSLGGCNGGGGEKPGPDGDKGKLKVVAGSNKSASGETDKDVLVDLYCCFAPDGTLGKWLTAKSQEFAAKFEQEHGVSVEIANVVQDGYDGIREKLISGTVSKELPVLAQIEESFLFQLHPICEDLSKYLSKKTIDNYLDGLTVSCSHDNTLYAVPFGRSYVALFVNENLVKKAGHTDDDFKTWEGMHQVAKDIAALGNDIEGYGLYWGDDAWFWESPLCSNGGQVVSDDGKKVTFADNDAGAVYMSLMKDMLLDGSACQYYDKTASSPVDIMIDSLLDGKLGCMLNSTGNYSYMKKPYVHVLDQPAGKDGKHIVTGGSNLVMCNTATETQKKVAAAFLEFLAEDKNAIEFSDASGYMVTTKTAYEDPEYKKIVEADPNVGRLADGIQYAHARPQTPHWAEMYSYVADNLKEFSMHPEKFDPVQLNKDIAAQCQKILDDAEK